MKKFFLSLLVAAGLPMAAWCNDGDEFTAETQEGATVTYRVLSEADKTCQVGGSYTRIYTFYSAISNYTGNVTIPEQVNGYTVTLVKQNAFGGVNNVWAGVSESSNLHIDRLTLPESITKIETLAFNNGDIKHLNLPSQASLGEEMFAGCKSLESIDLPAGITALPNKFFRSCKSPMLENYEIPSTVTSIGEECFAYTNLRSITVPATVQYVGNGAFSDCEQLTAAAVESAATQLSRSIFSYTALTEFSFPEGATAVPEYIFDNCKQLASVTLPATVTTIGNGAFYGCKSLKNIELPEGLTVIENGAFNNSGLTSIELPASLTAIKARSLYDCPLERIVSHIEVPFTIEADVFNSTTYEQAPLYVPEGTEQLYKDTPAWSRFYGIYPNPATGISQQPSQQPAVATRYTLAGRRAAAGQRGLHIVKHADGTVTKTIAQ